ncbi:SURP and G-patch domain-containing protein 1 isoform X1 [Neodiprion lecontei]|uniref:SURP and G-patch domain-containing protein 1 isoform X1 n=2 Tax=Hymenoptera TaxID=7399 RepID=A0A6J0BEG6_NEOLC|nr:SURP and G-patch domain-containing protein 1 isoform X1 [Neodiprion lecontei]
MAYRGVKGSDPFVSKTSRNERFAQMSKQEQIIQQKKLEIQAKMQEQKANQAVEGVKKSASSVASSTPSSTVATAIPPKKEEEKPVTSSTSSSSLSSALSSTVNLFANDGSFLDQFRKIANNKSSSKSEAAPVAIKTEEKKEEKTYENSRNDRDRKWNSEKSRDWENRRERRRNDSRWGGRSSDRRHSSSSSPSPTRRRPSPSPDNRHTYHQPPPNVNHAPPHPHFNQQQYPPPPPSMNQALVSQPPSSSSTIPPLMSQPIMQMTNLPPPNLRGIMPGPNVQMGGIHRMPPPPKNMNSMNFGGMDNAHVGNAQHVIPSPSHHVLRAPPPPPPPSMQALPPNTNVPPPGMRQIPQNVPPPSHTMQNIPVSNQTQQQQRVMQTQQQCNIPPPTSLGQPPNIPPPSIMPPMSQIPPNILPISTHAIVVTVASVPNVPPPNVVPQMIMSGPPPPVHNTAITSTINSIPPPNLNIPPPNVLPPANIIQNSPPPHLIPPQTSYPVQHPPQVPITVGQINMQLPPPVRQLHSLQPHSQLVCPVEAEQLARIVADCGDEIEQEVREKNAQDPKLWFLHQKQSAAYLQYRGLVAKFRAEKIGKESKNNGGELYSPEDALSDNEDHDKSQKHGSQYNHYSEDSREERKRKRRSRWGDPDNKVAVSSCVIGPPQLGLNVPGKLPQPGIAIPGQIGQPAVIIPPSKLSSNKVNPMLTKISRSDPALAQYARQTFGTSDLSEEQWKKAEDHYKINLLYQNLLKKREEVKRLEAQGKHKYEYDSDEETEGGTWEHKIRSAEMVATQMWAEELTAQAEGKHHIGDFLPPDELKRFMEQYNAVKQGKEPDLSDYKEFKLKEDNIGFQMLQKLGWSEGQGLGSEGSGRVDPVNKATNRLDSAGLGTERPDGISRDDDEFDAYRKRMMLAYRFRPNPLNNPRRPYY